VEKIAGGSAGGRRRKLRVLPIDKTRESLEKKSEEEALKGGRGNYPGKL